MRIGTWNLAGRGGPRQQDFVERLGCDVLLLTEVPEKLDMATRDVTWSEASIRPGVRYAAVVAPSLEGLPSPHPASAVAVIDGRVFCSSVLPWRSSGGAPPWSGTNQGERTEAACEAIGSLDLDVWGGDWNHAIQERDWAGSRRGRAAIEDVLGRLGLRVATAGLPSAGDVQRSIDHVAVPRGSDVESAERLVAADERGRLSDHDAYVVTVQLGRSTSSCPSGPKHRWLPLVYGLPSRTTFEAAERGEVLLGGCVVWDEAPRERCVDCGNER